MFIGKKWPYMKKKALWFQVEELINPSKFSQILSAKKGGNYRHDRCFASNTFEDMLQPKTSIKKHKIQRNWPNWTEVDQSGLKCYVDVAWQEHNNNILSEWYCFHGRKICFHR